MLLLLILLTLSQRLYSTHWATGFGSAIILILIGFALGMALGSSHFKRAAVLWISFGYSVPIVALVLSWVVYQENSWTISAADLSNRLLYSLVLFATGRAVTDTILFILFIALVFWIMFLVHTAVNYC